MPVSSRKVPVPIPDARATVPLKSMTAHSLVAGVAGAPWSPFAPGAP